MSKKDYIIKLMDSLSWKRALARWLKILVEWDLLGENTIDSLVQTLSNAINEINDTEKNLSFEREFGKIIGRTDLYAISLAEKSQRFISRVMQNLATAVFLPI